MTEEMKNALMDLLVYQGVYSKVKNVTNDDVLRFTNLEVFNTL